MRYGSQRTKCFRTQKTCICNKESSPGISDCVLAGAGKPATVVGQRKVLNKTCSVRDSERWKSDAAQLRRRPCAMASSGWIHAREPKLRGRFVGFYRDSKLVH
jgi:hypothetical protein